MKLNRWVYAGVGVTVLLIAGMVYAWSIIAAPIAAYFTDWSKAELSLTFTICMASFCLGGFAGGLLNGKLDVKWNVRISAIMFLAGFFIASRSQSTGWLYLGYGCLGGFASGLVYNAVMSTISKWFPDRQGLLSGILLMGFGLSSFIIGKIFQAYTPSGEGVEAWRQSLAAIGIISFCIIFICSFFFVKPDGEDLKPYKPAGRSTASSGEREEFTPAEMLKTGAFRLYFVWAVLLSAAGLAVISQARSVAAGVGTDISPGTIATVVGMISVFNGTGRLIFGGMYDKAGRKVTMSIITAAFMLSVGILILALLNKNFTLIVIGFICTGIAYGGVTPTNSAFISAFFGAENYPVNFSIINMNLLIASFGSTAAGMLYDRSGSYLSTFIIMIAAAALAMVFNLMIKKPVKK